MNTIILTDNLGGKTTEVKERIILWPNHIKQTQSPALSTSTQEHMKLSDKARRRVEGTKFYKLCNGSK